MATLSFEKKLKIASITRKLRSDMQKMRMDVCALLSHKDTTPEQMKQAQDMLQRIAAMQEQVQQKATPHHIDFKL